MSNTKQLYFSLEIRTAKLPVVFHLCSHVIMAWATPPHLSLPLFVSCELLVKLWLFSSLPPKLVAMSSPLPPSTKCCLDYPSSKYRCIFVSLRIPSSWGKGGGRALVVFSPYKCSQLGLFRVILCLCFKTSLRAKPFIWKWEWFAWKWTCRQTHFHTDSSARRLGLTLRQKTTRKWPIAIL